MAKQKLTDVANNGNKDAQYHLGLIFGKGLGTSKNLSEAHRYFLLAARQGHPVAQFHVAEAYRLGFFQANESEITHWYRLSAQQGYADSQNNLGLRLLEGSGISRNETDAVKWFRVSAKQGLPRAQYNLGIAYVRGIGVEKDFARGYAWVTLAARDGGDESAIKARDLIVRTLSANDLRKGEELLRLCLATKLRSCE